MSPYSVLSVQYLGEKQTFRVTDLEPLSDDDQTHSHSTMELGQSLSKLSLNSSELDDDIPPPPPVSQQLIVHKVTGRTKLEFVSARGDGGDDVWGGSKERATSLEAVGGMGDKIKLLKEIVLRPLNSDCSGDGERERVFTSLKSEMQVSCHSIHFLLQVLCSPVVCSFMDLLEWASLYWPGHWSPLQQLTPSVYQLFRSSPKRLGTHCKGSSLKPERSMHFVGTTCPD